MRHTPECFDDTSKGATMTHDTPLGHADDQLAPNWWAHNSLWELQTQLQPKKILHQVESSLTRVQE